MLVLIVEDSPSDRRIYRRYLQSRSEPAIEVIEAATGREGLARCAEAQPDCILLDYKLPDGSGLALIPELQRLSAAPIVVVTGQMEPGLQTEAYRLGAVRFLSKDFVSSASLLAAVDEVLRSSRP